MARDFLAVPISSSLNSGTEPVKEIMNEVFVSTVDKGMSKVLIFCNNWLRSGHSAGKFVAGIENIMEKKHINQACPERSNNGNSCVYDQIKSQELLAKLVISSELPFHFVKSTSFIEWAKNLQPLYTSVDLATIKTLCLGFYQIERQRLPHLYKDPCVRVCFSAHICGVADNKYICVTAHYIDDYFNFVRRIIGVKIIHNWDFPVITAQLDRCIANWEIPKKKKVLAFTTAITYNDYNEKLFDLFSCGVGGIKLHCIVQGFNEMFNIISDGLHEVFESITKMINFLAEDPNAMHIINELDIGFKISSPKSHLQLYDDRSWDSTLNMLSDAIAYKDVFNAYKYYDESFPLCGNWNEVESVVKLLKPIYEAVIILSSSQYPTSNLFLKIIFELRDVLPHVVFNKDTVYNRGYFLDLLLNVLDNYLKDCNSIMLVASLLDPRFKLTYLERCYAEHISDREEINKCIRNLCIEFEIEIRKEDSIEHNLGMLELERYLQEGPMEVREDNFDVLRWWKDNQSNYPILSRIARDNLAIPVSSVPPEFAFYTSRGNKNFRFVKLENQLGPRTMEALVCSYNWLSAASSIGKCVGKGAAIDLVEKHIPPSYKCPLRAYEAWSLSFLENIWSGRMSEEIVAIGGARLTVEKMQCLIKQTDEGGPHKWIPDDVINCYIDIMNNKGSISGKILILSTFDSQLLQLWGSSMDTREKNCERKSNIVEKGNSFLQNELVFMPIHIQNHWFVGVLNASKKEFQLLNSLNSVGGPYEETTHTLRLGIQVCIDAALDSQHALQGWRPDNVLNWPILPISNLPQQEDRCSCGLFALKYMQLWDGSKLACDFTQDDIHLFRKQLVGELIFSELNEMKNTQNEIKKTREEFLF
ncbi:zinc finger BED domain-containing protein DAYSLEEPER-like isoform X2 [Carex rostrata]